MGVGDIMLLDDTTFDAVSKSALASERLRMNLDMRNSDKDLSQRMLNALEPGTVLPIHRHRNTSETCIVLRGEATEIFYDDEGNEILRVTMKSGEACRGINIPKGLWHRIESMVTSTVIFEAKDGPYEPLTDRDILKL